jgi:hypothetical protein
MNNRGSIGNGFLGVIVLGLMAAGLSAGVLHSGIPWVAMGFVGLGFALACFFAGLLAVAIVETQRHPRGDSEFPGVLFWGLIGGSLAAAGVASWWFWSAPRSGVILGTWVTVGSIAAVGIAISMAVAIPERRKPTQ